MPAIMGGFRAEKKHTRFYTELWGKNGAQFFIDYASHDRLFQSASDFAGKQFGLFFKDKVMTSDVWKWLDQLSSFYPVGRFQYER